MASIRLKPQKSKFYYACYTDSDGIQRQQTTKTTNKKLAQEIADNLEAGYREKCTTSHLRESFSVLSNKIGKSASFTISMREHFLRWLQSIEGEPGRGTFKRYEQIIRDSLLAMGPAADQPLDEVNRQTFIDVRRAVADRTTAGNANTYTKLLKRVMRAAVDDGLLRDDPTRKIGFLKEEVSDIRRPFTEDELVKLKSVLTGEWHLIVHYGEHTGQRLGDIASCTWGQIDLKAGFWEFYSQKTARNMRVPFTPSLLGELKKLTPGERDAPLFPVAHQEKRSKDGESRVLSANFRRFLEQAGLATTRSKKNTGRGHGCARQVSPLCFHSLRHNASSNLAEAGVPESVLRDIIGHESPLVSKRYIHVRDQAKIDAVALIDNRQEATS